MRSTERPSASGSVSAGAGARTPGPAGPGGPLGPVSKPLPVTVAARRPPGRGRGGAGPRYSSGPGPPASHRDVTTTQ